MSLVRYLTEKRNTYLRLISTTLLIGAILLVVPSCSTATPEPSQTTASDPFELATPNPSETATLKTLSDNSTFLIAAKATGGMTAGVYGRLVLLGGGCVGMESLPGAANGDAVVAFPYGSQPSEDGSYITLPNNLKIKLGDEITGTGGYVELNQNPQALNAWPEAPPACFQATSIAIVDDIKTKN